MTSISQIPRDDLDYFISNNNILISNNDLIFKLLELGKYLPNSIPDSMVDWIIAHNLITLNIQIPFYNDLYEMSN